MDDRDFLCRGFQSIPHYCIAYTMLLKDRIGDNDPGAGFGGVSGDPSRRVVCHLAWRIEVACRCQRTRDVKEVNLP